MLISANSPAGVPFPSCCVSPDGKTLLQNQLQLHPPAAGAAGAALGLEGAEGRLGGASLQHGVAVTAVGALAEGLRRVGRLPAAPQPGTPNLQHLVEHRQQQDHQHGQRHPWTPWDEIVQGLLHNSRCH